MLILSAGCAALSPAKQETLEERVKNYMQAQMDGQWDRAYSFFDSSFRERIPRESYVAANRAKKMFYKESAIEEIKILPSGDQAMVKVRIDISTMGYDFKGVSRTQNWVKERGEWFVKSEPQSQKNPFAPQEKQK
jgi:hypothetical protein